MNSLHKYLLSGAAFAPADKLGDTTADDTLDLGPDDPADVADDGADAPDGDQGEADEEIQSDEPDVAAAPRKAAADAPADRNEGGSRAERRISALRERAEAADRRATEAVDRVARMERELQARSQPKQEDPNEEARRMELMTPDERAEYRVNKALQRNEQQTRALLFQQAELNDKGNFETQVQRDPLARRFKEEVETELQKIRAEGGNVPREAVLFYVMGRALHKKQNAGKAERKAEGRENIRRQTTKAGGVRSDLNGGRRSAGDSPEARERRLENERI